MENNIRAFPSIQVYRVPEREYVQLQRLRRQWTFLAALYQARTPEEERTPLEMSRAMLSDGFAEFAQQLHDILCAIKAMSPRPPH